MKVFIRERRMERHMTQIQLAEKLYTKDGKPIPQSYLSRLEKGKDLPSLELAFQIAEVLNCKIEDIYSRE